MMCICNTFHCELCDSNYLQEKFYQITIYLCILSYSRYILYNPYIVYSVSTNKRN